MQVRVGLLGCGNVGGAVARQLHNNADLITAQAGASITVTRIGVRDATQPRSVPLSPDVFTTDLHAIATDPEIDICVEVMGGIEPARELLLTAMKSRKSVVTANKELLASHGEELFDAAHDAGVDLLFEASVAGGIPLIRPLRESLAGERITRVMGIVNGTTNYILSEMAENGADFSKALQQAQKLGYAEADPEADIEGIDAAAKAAIIAMVAFGARCSAAEVSHTGISQISARDISAAARLGYVIKLLAVVERSGAGLSARVEPAMLPLVHPLASVRGAFNAVFVEGEHLGELMLYGPGAGPGPTAAAVLGDLVDAASNIVNGQQATRRFSLTSVGLSDPDSVTSEFYIRLAATDRPGVLARIAAIFGGNDVSIKSMEQWGSGKNAELVLITHSARAGDVQNTVTGLSNLEVVVSVNAVMPVLADQ